jgi:type IV pilus assembly protein PilP
MNWALMTAPFALAALMLVGCGDEKPGGAVSAGAVGAQQPPRAAGAAAPGKVGSPLAVPSDLPPLPEREITERDFADSNRDPFKAYVENVKTTIPVSGQHNVLLSKFSLEECKVTGIITGDAPRVLIDDPSGLGWVVHVGDFVGRAEKVHSGGAGGADIPVNWRVDRIRSNDVVFVREDPSRPDVPATTRVLSLRTPDEMNPEIRTGMPRAADLPPPPMFPGLPPAAAPPAAAAKGKGG